MFKNEMLRAEKSTNVNQKKKEENDSHERKFYLSRENDH